MFHPSHASAAFCHCTSLTQGLHIPDRASQQLYHPPNHVGSPNWRGEQPLGLSCCGYPCTVGCLSRCYLPRSGIGAALWFRVSHVAHCLAHSLLPSSVSRSGVGPGAIPWSHKVLLLVEQFGFVWIVYTFVILLLKESIPGAGCDPDLTGVAWDLSYFISVWLDWSSVRSSGNDCSLRS